MNTKLVVGGVLGVIFHLLRLYRNDTIEKEDEFTPFYGCITFLGWFFSCDSGRGMSTDWPSISGARIRFHPMSDKSMLPSDSSFVATCEALRHRLKYLFSAAAMASMLWVTFKVM